MIAKQHSYNSNTYLLSGMKFYLLNQGFVTLPSGAMCYVIQSALCYRVRFTLVSNCLYDDVVALYIFYGV